MKIAVVGLWHLGEIYSAGLAELGHTVIGIDTDKQAVKNLNNNTPPLAEPGLQDLLVKNRKAGRLAYTTDFSKISDCDAVWLTLDTPIDRTDTARLQSIFKTFGKIAPHLRDGAYVVVSSQMPVGTSGKVKKFLHEKNPRIKFEYVYTPENLQLGQAVKSFFEASRIVVGAENESAFETMRAVFGGLNTNIMTMNPTEAEMVKHALNSFLATSLSFTYDIADLCEQVGADIVKISKALRSDPRIGQKAYIDANIGFSGGTLGRDLRFLLAAAVEHGISMPVIAAVMKKNKHRKKIVYEKLEKHLGSIAGKSIAVLGLTYKPGTTTLRRSLALEIVRDLRKMGAKLNLHDPFVKKTGFISDLYETLSGCEAVLVITPWPELFGLDFSRARSLMKEPAIFFDTRNFFHEKEAAIKQAGFKYLGVGRGMV
ncbi:MAG: nucleotide sugar dehydrogenase [Patescibacteria group bacterium]